MSGHTTLNSTVVQLKARLIAVLNAGSLFLFLCRPGEGLSLCNNELQGAPSDSWPQTTFKILPLNQEFDSQSCHNSEKRIIISLFLTWCSVSILFSLRLPPHPSFLTILQCNILKFLVWNQRWCEPPNVWGTRNICCWRQMSRGFPAGMVSLCLS